MSNLVVIYYHDIVENGNGYSYQRVEEKKFEEQMRLLHNTGYASILFEDMDSALPDKSVLVAFDDGFQSVYERAIPIMRKYGIKGNIFLPTKYVEENNSHFMSWCVLRALYDAKEISIAAHTHSHKDIRTLDEITMKSEISQSNALLKEHLGMSPRAFCMPYGKYDAKSIQLLRNISDYQYLFGSNYGRIEEGKFKKKIIPRIGISNDDCIEIFKKKLEGAVDWKGTLQQARLALENLIGRRVTQYDID